MKTRWIKLIGGVVGSVITLSMLFAIPLGLDNNSIWGCKRTLIFLTGLLIFLAAIYYREDNFIGKAFHTHSGQLYLAVGALSFFIILTYIWYISVGLWTIWPNEMSYFDLQATAFRHGQSNLEITPDPALLTLDNYELYEPGNREGMEVLWDATLYNGKYYLYWGPAPALLLAIVKFFYSLEIGDKPITFAFTAGIFIFAVLLIIRIWKVHFNEAPRWAVLLGVAFLGLVNPILFILLEARIYEGAIMAGQFFIVGGLFCLYTSFNKPSIWRLAFAGLFFALAVGSRTTLVPSVAILAFILMIWAFRTQKTKAWTYILAFGTPLFIGAVMYMSYNYARFGSITEFGFRYQLTSYNLYKSMGETYSPVYILPNLYKTLFNSVEQRITFPYYFPTRWDGPNWLEKDYPKFYLLLSESITGIFIASPFVIFAFLAALNKSKDFRWILLSITGAFFMAFATMQIFFFTAMRYLLDFIPALALLSVIGFWQGLKTFKTQPVIRFAISISGIILGVYSISMSLLLPISGRLESYRVFNPGLLEKMTCVINTLFHIK